MSFRLPVVTIYTKKHTEWTEMVQLGPKYVKCSYIIIQSLIIQLFQLSLIIPELNAIQNFP